MSDGLNSGRAAFSRGGVAALVAGGFVLFLALLFLLGRGEAPLANRQDGEAHAAATGLNGYAGLARLLEAQGLTVTRSRSPKGLETRGILVLTPPWWTDPDELAALLDSRRRLGPTLVILPKWRAGLPPGNLPAEAAGKFKRGWVVLNGAMSTEWPAQLPPPYRFVHVRAEPVAGRPPRWQGLGRSGILPSPEMLHAEPGLHHQPLIADGAGRALALLVRRRQAGEVDPAASRVIFLAEPDLANNWGMADPARAAATLALIGALQEGPASRVTFDLTLNGFGASENLLTLAFRPPFLAATLCLILALALVFWRALLRFGPAAVRGPGIAFGKRQLIENGAALILRARRWRLLAQPYAALVARRIARQLGLARADPPAIDAALAVRLPAAEPFSPRAARLAAASRPGEILSAAAALDDLTAMLAKEA